VQITFVIWASNDSGPHFGYQICMGGKKGPAFSVTDSGTRFALDFLPGRKPGRRAFGVEPIGVESVTRDRSDNHHVEKVDRRCSDSLSCSSFGVGAAGQRG
jgi:hypothetical protein